MRDHPCRALAALGAFAAGLLLASASSSKRPAADAASACDSLAGVNPRLQSLCVNYCEARDCVTSDAPECDDLLANYDRLRGEGDPEMPCLPTCPCFTVEDLRNHPADLNQCYYGLNDRGEYLGIDEVNTPSGAAAFIDLGSGLGSNCVYTDYTQGTGVFAPIFTTEEIARVCMDKIALIIAERELTCTVIF